MQRGLSSEINPKPAGAPALMSWLTFKKKRKTLQVSHAALSASKKQKMHLQELLLLFPSCWRLESGF